MTSYPLFQGGSGSYTLEWFWGLEVGIWQPREFESHCPTDGQGGGGLYFTQFFVDPWLGTECLKRNEPHSPNRRTDRRTNATSTYSTTIRTTQPLDPPLPHFIFGWNDFYTSSIHEGWLQKWISRFLISTKCSQIFLFNKVTIILIVSLGNVAWIQTHLHYLKILRYSWAVYRILLYLSNFGWSLTSRSSWKWFWASSWKVSTLKKSRQLEFILIFDLFVEHVLHPADFLKRDWNELMLELDV